MIEDLASQDPTTEVFWRAARERRLLIQLCADCGRHQFYPRTLCVACGSNKIVWKEAAGSGTVYSITTVRMQVIETRMPPYQVALVELDEGPRLLATISGEAASIGDRLRLVWEEREQLPPLPAFTRV